MSVLLLVIILGIVEGITEYLPVSSTGHLILATELLGFDANKWALFNVAIQPGAILAIVVLYWRTFRDVLVGMWRREPSAWRFVRNLLVAFFPAVVLGLAIGDYVELLLGNAVVVAWALIIGGFAILIVERRARPTDCDGVANVTLSHSVGIGLVQCLAMIPGVSRSGATAANGVGVIPNALKPAAPPSATLSFCSMIHWSRVRGIPGMKAPNSAIPLATKSGRSTISGLWPAICATRSFSSRIVMISGPASS
jgi:undecaprenyl-diphosphatase UppP